MKAATLHCPDCGAPASPGDRQCRYCRARLATVKCPECFAAAFVGMRHCPACGTALIREDALDEGTVLACPACPGALHPIRVGSSFMRECDGCGGLFLDNRTFLAICHDRERRAALESRRPRVGEPPPEPVLPVVYFACPVCRAMMSRVNFARMSGVIVDVCREHGTWFGQGELQRVVGFIARGGLARWFARAEQESFDHYLREAALAATLDPSRSFFAPFVPEGGW